MTARLIIWETPFAGTWFPSVQLFVENVCRDYEIGWMPKIAAVVAPEGIDKYPKWLVRFDEVQAFASFEEAGSPRIFRDVPGAGGRNCSFELLNSPWVKDYENLVFRPTGPESQLEPVDFRHFLIFGGDSNIEVLTPNEPAIQQVDERTELHYRFEL